MATRAQIQNKIDEIKQTPNLTKDQIKSQVSTWLDTADETADSKTRILNDLVSYPNYG